jgi:hypothetical protein
MPARVPIVTVAGLDNPQAVVDEGLRRSLAATVVAAWVLTVDGGLELGFPDDTPPDVARARVLDRLNELRPYWRENSAAAATTRDPESRNCEHRTSADAAPRPRTRSFSCASPLGRKDRRVDGSRGPKPRLSVSPASESRGRRGGVASAARTVAAVEIGFTMVKPPLSGFGWAREEPKRRRSSLPPAPSGAKRLVAAGTRAEPEKEANPCPGHP